MLRIETSDRSTDEMILDHMSGYIVELRPVPSSDEDPPSSYGDFRLEGLVRADGVSALLVQELTEDEDGELVEVGKSRFFDPHEVIIMVY